MSSFGRGVSYAVTLLCCYATSVLRGPWRFLQFFIDNPSGRTMALGLTQPLTEMSTSNISWGVKAAGV